MVHVTFKCISQNLFSPTFPEDGGVYAFGSDYYGCLGVDNQEGEEVTSPIAIPFFENKPVEQVSGSTKSALNPNILF